MLQNMFLRGTEKEQEEGTHYNISRGRIARVLQLQLQFRKRETVTSRPENNALARGKRCVTGHKRREKDARKQKGGCTQTGRRMRTGRKENVHILQ